MVRERANQPFTDALHGEGKPLTAHAKGFLEDGEFVAFLRHYQSIHISRVRSQASPIACPPCPMGKTIRLHPSPLPGAAQLWAAYEVPCHPFCEHLEARGYPGRRWGPGGFQSGDGQGMRSQEKQWSVCHGLTMLQKEKVQVGHQVLRRIMDPVRELFSRLGSKGWLNPWARPVYGSFQSRESGVRC